MVERTGYQHGQFSWVDLLARNLDEAIDFYTNFFGWQCVKQDTHGGGPYAQFELDGKSVAGIGQMSQEMIDQEVPACWNSYINVDDIRSATRQAEELGATVTIPVTKVLDAGWLSYVSDPIGAQVAFWQKNQHIGAQRTQDYHCLCWNELCTRDIDRAKEFYTQLLGWEFSDYSPANSRYLIVSNRGEESSGMLEMDERWGDMQAQWTIYFAVENVDLATDQLRQLGGNVVTPPHDISEGRQAMVTDDQGALFNLVESTEQPEESA